MSLNMVRTIPTWRLKFEDNTHYINLTLKPKTNQELFLLVQRFAEKLKEIEVRLYLHNILYCYHQVILKINYYLNISD